MRQLERNKEIIKALNFKRTEDVVDSNGYKTGEKKVIYSPVITFKGHVSGAKGSSQVDVFGTDVVYDKVISMSKSVFKKLALDENTVFFIDIKVKFQDGTPLYNYRVKRIAETINDVLIAVVKVND